MNFLELDKWEKLEENELLTSVYVRNGLGENIKHNIQETTDRCNKNRKITQRCAHCHQDQESLNETDMGERIIKISTFYSTIYTCLSCYNIYHANM